MKVAQFSELCHREYARDEGIVVALHLTPESHAELTADALSSGPVEFTDGEPPPGPCGAKLRTLTNPATTGQAMHSIDVLISTVDFDGFADTAEVRRWVKVPRLPPVLTASLADEITP